jgi:tetratricopeptide (TPR) repeat protein
MVSLIRRSMGIAVLSCALLLAGCKPAPPAERLAEAQQLLQERQTALAIIKLEQLVADAPDDPATTDARMILGVYFMDSLRQFKRAEPFFRAVYEKEGVKTERGAAAFMRLVQIPAAQQDFDGALAIVDEAAKTIDANNDPEMVDNLAFVRTDVQMASQNDAMTSAALEAWGSIMLDSKDPGSRGRAREQLASFYRRTGDFMKSNEVYDRYLAKFADDPTTPQLILAQAINYRLIEKFVEADVLFDKGQEMMSSTIALELNKQRRGESLVALARYNEAMERYDVAEALMLQAMGENPMTRLAIETQFSIGDMFARSRQFDRAIETFERIDKENPNSNIGANARQRIDAVIELRRNIEAAEAAMAAESGTPETTGTLEAATPPAAEPAP